MPVAATARPLGHVLVPTAAITAMVFADDRVTSGTPAAAAQEPARPSLTQRGLVDVEAPLLVDDRVIGEIDLRVDAGGAGDIDAERLVRLLTPLLDPPLLAALTARVAGRARVPLGDLTIPPLVIVYDPATLELRATLPAARMRSRTLSVRGYETPDPSRFMPQAGYAGGVAIGATQRFVESGPNRGRAPLLLSADGFLTAGGFPGVTLRGGGLLTERPGGGFDVERLQTRLTYDGFANAVHYVAGEFNPALTGFQGGGPILGIGVARDYAGIRPFENIRPSGRGGVTLDRPSTVIVEVNGVETRRLQLDPGRYQLTDLSATSGANDVRLFVQDDLGRREIASAAFFAATSMLSEGLTDFGAAVGRRESARTRYGGPVIATGYVRHGVTGNLTVGAGGQFAAGDWQANGEVVAGTPLGLFRLQGALSDVRGRGGHALSLDWLATKRTGASTWTFTVLSSLFGRDFASPFDRFGRVNDQRWRIDARADWRRDRVGAALVGSLASTRSHSEEEGLDVNAYYTLGRLAFTGTLGIERTGRDPWKPRALVGVSLQLGSRATASARLDTKRDTALAEISRYPVDQVGDLSGRLQLGRDADRYGLSGEARYFGNRFIASAEQNLFYAGDGRGPATRETVLRASTFIGIADGAVAIGRPTAGNFAIYDRHASLRGDAVTVRDEAGLVVGRQDWLGSPLVPFNRAFSPVYQSYEVDPLPTGYDLGESRLAAFPGAFSGYRVAVGSDASRVALGYLVTPEGPLAEVSGTAIPVGGKDGDARPFFSNAAGRFAVDRLSPGTWRLMVGDVEVARFTVSPKSEGMVDVGRLQVRTR